MRKSQFALVALPPPPVPVIVKWCSEDAIIADAAAAAVADDGKIKQMVLLSKAKRN